MIFSNFQLAFFNLGPWEILLVLIVVLVLFGAKRLPELARGLGLGINEFRDAVDSSKKEIMDAVDSKDLAKKNDESEEKTFSYEFEPEEDEILEDLLPKNISTQVFKALLENAASEQGSRMTAMDNATRNAGDLVDKLTINYNRSRQASITKELIEIISGAESL